MAVAMASILGKTRPDLGLEALDRFRNRRDMANRLRRFNRGLLLDDDELRSIARCGNALGSVVMLRRGNDGNVRPGGVATCKSAWGCLGCAARRRAEHAAVVQWLVNKHQTAGGHVSLASFTLAHYPADALAKLLTALRDAFTDMKRLKVYKDAVNDYGIQGWIGALEITDGHSGWHPHLHVLFFHDTFLGVEDGDNADLRAALHEAFAHQIKRHLGRQIHEIYGVDLVPVKTEGDDGVVARYLGKIQLEMARQDLKTGRRSSSRSPWQIALDAAETGDARDTARWVEYLHATKGRNVITKSKSLTDLYGEPTDAEINALIGNDQPDDQADDDNDDDEVEDVASIDAAVWTDAQRTTTPDGGSLITAVLVEFEDQGPQAAADLLGRHLDHVHVVTHPDSGLPHLEYRDRGSTITVAPATDDDDRIDYDQLGPVARAWYGAQDPKGGDNR
jgi:hypothetical protein